MDVCSPDANQYKVGYDGSTLNDLSTNMPAHLLVSRILFHAEADLYAWTPITRPHNAPGRHKIFTRYSFGDNLRCKLLKWDFIIYITDLCCYIICMQRDVTMGMRHPQGGATVVSGPWRVTPISARRRFSVSCNQWLCDQLCSFGLSPKGAYNTVKL